MALLIEPMVEDVRRSLDEVTMSGELAIFSTGLEDLFSASFKDEDIKDRLLDGWRYVAARVAGPHLPGLHMDINPTDNDALVPQAGSGGSHSPFLRVMGTRVRAGDVKAQRQTMRGYTKIQSTGRAATSSRPAYVFEDYEFIVNDGSEVSSEDAAVKPTAQVTVVALPMFGGDGSFDGVQWSGSAMAIDAPDKLREAIIQYAVASCFMTKREVELARAARENMFREIRPYMLPIARTEEVSQE